ncbi:MAG: hypothetical protein ACREUA_00985 [Burkholderiales bacterium]
MDFNPWFPLPKLIRKIPVCEPVNRSYPANRPPIQRNIPLIRILCCWPINTPKVLPVQAVEVHRGHETGLIIYEFNPVADNTSIQRVTA